MVRSMPSTAGRVNILTRWRTRRAGEFVSMARTPVSLEARVGARLEPPVGVPRKSPAVGAMHRSLVLPGPPAEMRAVVIRVRLPQFRFGVHDEGPMLCHRFGNGTALKHQ